MTALLNFKMLTKTQFLYKLFWGQCVKQSRVKKAWLILNDISCLVQDSKQMFPVW